MEKNRSRDAILFVLLFVMVMASRLPFIDHGYGCDQDAWRVASVATAMPTTGRYIASRLPGYPVQEITYALLPLKTPVLFNLVTAVLSAVCVVYFSKFIRLLGLRRHLSPAIALAFVPVIYINSVNSMDYLWALCFLMIACYAAAARAYLLSGALLGVAVGCRLSSAGMLLPLLFFLRYVNHSRAYREYAQLIVGFLVTSLIVLLPVLMEYGGRFLINPAGHASALNIVKNITVDLWGLVGVLGIAWGCILLVIKASGAQKFRDMALDPINQFSLLAITVYAAAYILAPFEAGYLIPVVPFVILLFAHNLPPGQSIVLSSVMAASSFVIGINTSDMPWSVKDGAPSYRLTIGGRSVDVHVLRGPILEDRLQRIAREAYAQKVIDVISRAEDRSVFVCGDWFVHLAVELHKPVKDNTEEFDSFTYHNAVVHDIIDQARAKEFRDRHMHVYYLTGQDQYNAAVYKFSLKESGAREVVF